jgi:hypothetical protein
VRTFSAGEDGELEVVLLDGARLQTSRRYRGALEARLRAGAR